MPPTAPYVQHTTSRTEPQRYVTAFPSHLYQSATDGPDKAGGLTLGLVHFGLPHLARVVHALQLAHRSPQPITILCVGSSFTWGKGLKNIATQGFVAQLAGWLKASRPTYPTPRALALPLHDP